MNDDPKRSNALSDNVLGDRMGAGEPGETSSSDAGWARNGIGVTAEKELPEVMPDLFAEAAARLAKEAEPGVGDRLQLRANAQAALLACARTR